MDPSGREGIIGLDLETGDPPFLVTAFTGASYFTKVSGDRIAWGGLAADDDGAMMHVWTKRIGEAQPTLIDSFYPVGAGLFGLDLSGDLLVYSRNWELVIRDLEAETERAYYFVNQVYSPTTDGRYVFWEAWDYHSERDRPENNILGFDTQTGSLFTVIANDHYNHDPVVSNGYLLWHGEFSDLYGTPVADVLPSSSRTSTGTEGSDWRFFPETQHYLHLGFNAYWDHNGGLPVFGFPLTEEFEQTAVFEQDSPTVSVNRTVQIFERQGFEWHPEHAGTPYEVLLGRLGFEAAERAGLLDGEPFQRRSTGDITPSHCTSFAETGHLLCMEFLGFWMSRGLELGDEGVSFRESLALFGYPISEPFIDPETGAVVQYFERAVFELHPDNPEPYQVLLRHLGREQLEDFGWQ